MNHAPYQPELTQKAMSLLRNSDSFEWYLIPLLAFVVYIYFNEISKKNWKGITAGLSLYAVHWFFEIFLATTPAFIEGVCLPRRVPAGCLRPCGPLRVLPSGAPITLYLKSP